MCSLLPYFIGSIGREQHFSSHHTTHTHAPLFCLHLFLASLSSFHVSPHTNPSSLHLCCLHLHFLASFQSHPFWSVKRLGNPTRFFFFPLDSWGKKLRNLETGAQVQLQLVIKKQHCQAWRDVRNDSGFDLSKPLHVTSAHGYEDILCKVYICTGWKNCYAIHTHKYIYTKEQKWNWNYIYIHTKYKNSSNGTTLAL